jgi:hypothetical protein
VLSGTPNIVPSGTPVSCYRERKQGLTHGNKSGNRALNLESNPESNFEERARDVQNLIRETASGLSVTAKKSGCGSISRKDETTQATAETPELPLDDRSGGTR